MTDTNDPCANPWSIEERLAALELDRDALSIRCNRLEAQLLDAVTSTNKLTAMIATLAVSSAEAMVAMTDGLRLTRERIAEVAADGVHTSEDVTVIIHRLITIENQMGIEYRAKLLTAVDEHLEADYERAQYGDVDLGGSNVD